VCGPVTARQECRGAETALEYERQVDKLVEAILTLDADVLGLVEVENSELDDGTPVDPLATLVEELNAVAGAGTYDRIDTGTVGTDTIRVGYLYRPAAATPLGDHAVLDASVDPRFDDDRNRPAVAQSFVENATGEVITVTVNHFKSKGCTGAIGDDLDQGDGQGCWNPTRTAAAQALVDWLDDDPTDVGDSDHLVIGDLNAYAMEDPIRVLSDAGYVDLAEIFAGPDPYSYVFDGQWGSLDYVLASPSLAAQVTGAGVHHINADEPSVLDYNTNFKSAGQIDSLYEADQYRTSDHDPLLVGLALDAGEVELVASAPRLWPPNHRLRTVDLTATVDGSPAAVTITAVTSSEADAGLGDGDLPGDIVLVDADTVEVRAERFSRPGRTYTITARITGSGQTVVGVDAVVLVPHDQRPR
jgi:predicted extracellular nuclease